MSNVTLFFTCTTLFAFLFPLAKLAPFWREARRERRLAFHRNALADIDAALALSPDANTLARQRRQHQAALAVLERAAA